MKKTLVLALAAALLAMLLAGCGQSGGLAEIEKEGKIVVALNANFPPFEYMGDGTKVAGVDVEIANAIAKELGVTVEFLETDFDGIIASLAAGKCDIAISGITITEERQKEVDFSDPYIKSVQYLILPEVTDIATMEDLAGKRIGTPLGYTGQFVIEDEMDPEGEGVLVDKGCEVKTYRSPLEATLDMQAGRIDVVIMDEYVAQKIASENEGVKAIRLVYEDGSDVAEEYGVAVQKGDAELMAKINTVVKRLVSDGSIERWVIEHSQ